MKRCFELALNGISEVSPNPMVACVIVHNGEIIGEGYHQEYGKAHAEVNAIHSVKNKEYLKQCTLYVNLEPCSHFGKTPPCSDLIIKHQIPKVVIANKDPFDKVSGRGMDRLKAAGVEVLFGILKDEGKLLNKRFFYFHENRSPYVILKWAQTVDGFMDIDRSENTKESYWITSSFSKILVHKWRSEEDGILVGSNTVRNDDPQLNCRLVKGKNPIRICIDKELKLDKSHKIFNEEGTCLIFNEKVEKESGRLKYFQLDFSKEVLAQVMSKLFEENIQSIIVEGGKKILQQFIDLDLWNEARIFHSEIKFNKGLLAPEINGSIISNNHMGADLLQVLLNKNKE